MDYTFLTLICAAAFALAGLLFAAASHRALGRAREGVRDCAALAEMLDAELTKVTLELNTLTRVASDQTWRLRALEGRADAAAAEAEPQAAAEAPAAAPTITERRHRVTQLARRGVETNAIASILNMPAGEVELMVGLSRSY